MKYRRQLQARSQQISRFSDTKKSSKKKAHFSLRFCAVSISDQLQISLRSLINLKTD